jgi:hypothetical protein
MDTRERLLELSRLVSPAAPVVSVYVDTRWTDEHQRGRVRVFVKNAVRAARHHLGGPDMAPQTPPRSPRPGEAGARVDDASTRSGEMARPEGAGTREGGAAAADLDWIEAEVEALVAQVEHPDVRGVALFACADLGLRLALPVHVPFEDTFVVQARPYVTPLARLLDEVRPSVVAFVDGASARLVPVGLEGAGEELALEHEVERRHRRGGWALLAQSRYQRHIEAHREQHFAAVARALEGLVTERAVERIVLAGDARAVAELRRHLAPAVAARVAGALAARRHDPAAALADRALALLTTRERAEEQAEIESVLTEAAKGGRAVAGRPATVAAVSRGAVHRLYLVRSAERPAEALVPQVLAAGGGVEVVDDAPALVRVGGIAARLRYPLGGAP